MTEQKVSILGTIRETGNKILKKVQDYSLERLVWCIAAIALCWTEVQNYHRYIFWQQMWIMAGLGTFYCLKLGFLAKGKRIMCGIITAFGVFLTLQMVQTNFFAGYHYLNLPMGVLATVLLNYYALVLWDAIKERRFPLRVGPSLILILWMIVKQSSVYNYRQFYLYMLIGLVPFMMMKKGIRTRRCVLNGILDGLCIGFFVIQGYAWMHRPYNYNEIRYVGISNACTTMSRIYLAYFAAWIIRYVQIARTKCNFFTGVGRVFCWLMAAFVLALEYLTGSRSAVLAMILMTVIAVAVRYLHPKEKQWKNIRKFLLWSVNCACIGVVSLALFPIAYASVRYLPAYFNEPDYVDAIGNRLLSRPIQEWGENFGWNNEYDEITSVMPDEGVDNPKYVTYAESVEHNLGRIIPGAEVYLEEVLEEKLRAAGLRRDLWHAEYDLENGVYTKEQYGARVEYLHQYYAPKEESEENAEETSGAAANEDKSIGNSDSILVTTYKTIVEKLLSTLVLRTDAEEVSAVELPKKASGGAEQVARGEKGDSSEYPWYADEEFPGNGMALRNAIHEYAISKLNNEGHPAESFEMWVTSTNSQPHAHNIFLIEGYDFGIPSMILMVLLFAVTAGIGLYNAIRFGKVEYMLPVLLIAGMTVFGWFESGFHYKAGIMAWVLLCVIFTDVISIKKPKKAKEGMEEKA